MKDNTYNGWTNYATWRINLEIFDCWSLDDYKDAFLGLQDAYALSKCLEDYAQEMLELDCGNKLTLDYADAFLSEVNWYEIAEKITEQYNAEQTETQGE